MTIGVARVSTRQSVAEPGGVLLVACYELGHQPFNLASPRAALRASGFAPAAVDTSVDTLADAAIEAAALVAISVPMHTALRLGVAVAERVRAINPGAHLCLYGHYAHLNAAYLLDQIADSVVGGEYETTLVHLAEALRDGGDLATVAGLRTTDAPAAPVIERIVFAAPERDALPAMDKYAQLEWAGETRFAGYVEASRGCHHLCTHCPIPPVYGGRFFAVPRATVVADALQQVATGARHITFGDPDLFNGPTHGLRIMREVRAVDPDVTFDATIKIEHILEHADRIPELAELGCIFVVCAVETLNQDVLRRLKKGHTKADVERALALLDAVGIAMRPSLLPFTPWSTPAEYAELLTFVAEHDLVDHIDPVHLSIRLLVPPGSLILGEDPDGEHFGELDPPQLQHRWAHPDPEMDALQRDVSALVEAAASRSDPARVTFRAIWLAAAARTGLLPERPPVPVIHRPKAPRLTEHWFC